MRCDEMPLDGHIDGNPPARTGMQRLRSRAPQTTFDSRHGLLPLAADQERRSDTIPAPRPAAGPQHPHRHRTRASALNSGLAFPDDLRVKAAGPVLGHLQIDRADVGSG